MAVFYGQSEALAAHGCGFAAGASAYHIFHAHSPLSPAEAGRF
jgi:hypothetical protein